MISALKLPLTLIRGTNRWTIRRCDTRGPCDRVKPVVIATYIEFRPGSAPRRKQSLTNPSRVERVPSGFALPQDCVKVPGAQHHKGAQFWYRQMMRRELPRRGMP